MDYIQYIINNPKVITDVIAYLIAFSSIIVKFTPTKEDDKIWASKEPIVLKALKIFSLYKR